MAISGKLAPNTYKPFGAASITTTIQPVWAPASGKVVVLMGLDLRMTAGAVTQIDITDGTAAAAGTILSYPINTDWLKISGIYKSLSSANNKLGIKATAGAGTVSGTFYGREVIP